MSLARSTQTSEAPTLALLREKRAAILEVAARRGVSRIRVFGSVARGDATAVSDIDLLVDFDPTQRGLDLFAFGREVEAIVQHPVEVGTEVHPVIRERVEAEAVAL